LYTVGEKLGIFSHLRPLASSAIGVMAFVAAFSLLTPFAFSSLIFASLGIITVVYLWFFYVDIPKIKGIPEIPGGEVLAGHLNLLGDDHATKAEEWSCKNGWPVFQLRMGRRRAIILNSFEAAREWMVKNQSATLDRPWFYTFHGVVSKSSGKLRPKKHIETLHSLNLTYSCNHRD
jgi:phenylacetate 2-hydroxylase